MHDFGVIVADVAEKHDEVIIHGVPCSLGGSASRAFNEVSHNVSHPKAVVLEVLVLLIGSLHITYLPLNIFRFGNSS